MAFGEELGVWQMRRTILINADLIDRPKRRRKRGAPRIPLGVNEFLGFWSINWIFKYFGKGKKNKKKRGIWEDPEAPGSSRLRPSG